MKPVAFVIRIPTKQFSKHDDPDEVAKVLAENMKYTLKRSEAMEGELPFDINNVTAEPVYDGPERSPEENQGVGSCSVDQQGQRNPTERRSRRARGAR